MTKAESYMSETTALIEQSLVDCEGIGETVYVLLRVDWSRKGRRNWKVLLGSRTVQSFETLSADEVIQSLTPKQAERLNLRTLKVGMTRSIPRCCGHYDDTRGRGAWKRSLRVLAVKSGSPLVKRIREYVEARKNADKLVNDAETAFRLEARKALLPVVARHLNQNQEWVEAYLTKLGFGADLLNIEKAVPEPPCFYTSY